MRKLRIGRHSEVGHVNYVAHVASGVGRIGIGGGSGLAIQTSLIHMSDLTENGK